MTTIVRSAVLLVCLAGCARTARVVPHPVRGMVERSGAPVADATVIFHPDAPLPDGIHNPIGITDASGNFDLTTLQQGDGAPAGEYRVTIELRAKRLAGEEHVRDGPHLLPEKYARPSTTPFRASVKPEANAIPKFVVPR